MKFKHLIALSLALACCTALSAQTVAAIEYYFDSDPGPGNGVQIYGRNTVELNQSISTASLAPGIHRFYTRACNDDGVWGLPQSTAFLVPFTAAEFVERDVARIEYYFDADPGPGNGTPVYGRNTVAVDDVIATADLSAGIHRLYVRARDDAGIWGLPQSTAFLIPFAAPAFAERSVAAIEYFYDADPGAGNGIPLYGRNTVALDQLLGTASLATGIHRVHVRAQDDDGIWGMPQSAAFLIPWPAEPGVAVSQLEYFIDTDPGPGNGIPVNVADGTSVSVDFSAVIGEIEHGNHWLYVRARDVNGGWGFPACCQFSDGVPAFLTISVADGVVSLAWQDLYGIDTYKVYSAPLPEGTWAEDLGGTFGPSDWSAPESGVYRFYKVTSIYGE